MTMESLTLSGTILLLILLSLLPATNTAHIRCSNRMRMKHSDENDCKRLCVAYGHPHYRTFDGLYYTFQGICDYILVREKSGGNFSVIVENVANGSSGVTFAKTITILAEDHKIRFVRGMSPTIDGKEVSPIGKFRFSSGTLSSSGLFVAVFFDCGLEVLWDQGTSVYVYLPVNYMKQVEGLCGNYDNDPQNDLSDTLSGRNSITPDEFANLWRVSSSCETSNSKTSRDSCLTNPKRNEREKDTCKVITEGDTFAKCRMLVSSHTEYYHNCLFDACGCDEGGECECLCTAVGAFAEECSHHGIHVNWRSNKFCPKMCDNSMIYSPCISPCRPTCEQDLVSGSPCDNAECVEGCTCPDGKVLNDVGECVPVSKCGCKHGGQLFSAGTSTVINCQECVCTDRKWECSGRPCDHN